MFNELFSTMKFKTHSEKVKTEVLLEYYMSDIPENFYRNQFELAKEYEGTTFTDWVIILTHEPFMSWKNSQIELIAATQTDKALASGEELKDREAVNLLRARTDMLNKNQKVVKPTIIVIPEALFFEEEK